MGAVQAQELGEVKWSLAERMEGEPTEARGRRGAFARGEIVRTHVLRPTWHFVAPEDLRWMQRLTGARVAARIRSAGSLSSGSTSGSSTAVSGSSGTPWPAASR